MAFLDDDARAGTDWLETARDLIERNPENLCCVGGPIHRSTRARSGLVAGLYEIRTRGDVQRT